MEKVAEICNFDFPHYVLEKKWKKVSSPLLRKYFLLEIEQSNL